MVFSGLPNHCTRNVLGKTKTNSTSSACSGKPKPLNLYMEVAMSYVRHKTVFVRRYTRRRFGRWEWVIQHWRSHPGQMSFSFD